MFTGMTIEELINSVERAEKHAREEKIVKTAEVLDYPLYRAAEWREVVGVA